jgi:hypothetical protein
MCALNGYCHMVCLRGGVTGRPELPPFESILGLVLLQDGSPLLIGREPDPLSRKIVPLSTHRGTDASRKSGAV